MAQKKLTAAEKSDLRQDRQTALAHAMATAHVDGDINVTIKRAEAYLKFLRGDSK